jgi:hypothetical protein
MRFLGIPSYMEIIMWSITRSTQVVQQLKIAAVTFAGVLLSIRISGAVFGFILELYYCSTNTTTRRDETELFTVH